ncbi:hypothetical protein OQA88_5184 [Cercophora sp. LCS_1]
MPVDSDISVVDENPDALPLSIATHTHGIPLHDLKPPEPDTKSAIPGITTVPADAPNDADRPPREKEPGFIQRRILDPMGTRLRPVASLKWMFLSSALFHALYCAFISAVLLPGAPGTLPWNASATNTIVSVLSQISALLIGALLKSLLTTVRPAMAARRQGTRFSSWIAQGSSGWITAVKLACANRFVDLWSDFRVFLPIIGLILGAMLKFQADFVFSFVPSGTAMRVYAGLITPDLNVLRLMSNADLAMYAHLWTAGLLSHSMNAVSWTLNGCSGESCRAMIMPGAIATARAVRPMLNTSVYFDDLFIKDDVLRLDDVVSFVVQYNVPSAGDLTFDVEKDCVYTRYTNLDKANGLQICLKQDGLSMLVGWVACPWQLHDHNNTLCESTSDWRTAMPMEFGTRMSLHTLPTTASYDRGSQAIINVQPLAGDPTQTLMDASVFKEVMELIFVPRVNASATDLAAVNALIYSITWMHRLYKSTLPSDNYSLTVALHNLLAIPLQFSVTANIYTNYTATSLGGLTGVVTLNDSMITTARGGQQSSRFVIQFWVGVLFMVGGAAIHVLVLACLVWVVHRWKGIDGVAPEDTGLVEIDAIRTGRRVEVIDGDSTGLVRVGILGFRGRGSDRSEDAEVVGTSLDDYLRDEEESSGWKIMRGLRKRKARIREVVDAAPAR